MNNNPYVSVIIPNYNHARYLDQRIQSVLNQTYQNFEVIILDDKSTDNSLEVIAKYKEDPHISQIVVNEQNSGSTFKQWDKGIHLAQGNLIWIAESDDWCELNLLEELVKGFSLCNGVVLVRASYIFTDGRDYINKSKESKVRVYNSKKYIENKLARSCVIRNASGVLFDRNCGLKVSTKYLSFQSTGDYMFWVEVAEQGKVVELNKNLTYCRVHSGSVTSNNISKGITSQEDRKVYEYICLKHKLNLWQRYVVQRTRSDIYHNLDYDNETIRIQILRLWNIKRKNYQFEKFILWLINSLNRHFGILI